MTHALLLLLFPPPCLASLPVRVGTRLRAMLLTTGQIGLPTRVPLTVRLLTRALRRRYDALMSLRHGLHTCAVKAAWGLSRRGL